MSDETKDVQETPEEASTEAAEETVAEESVAEEAAEAAGEMAEEAKEAVEDAAEAVGEEVAEAADPEPEDAGSEDKDDRTYEVSFESLGLTKTLDKMTAKELRQLCVEKIPAIQGASGMSKEDLVTRIKEIFGISDEEGSVSPYKDRIFALKREIKELRSQKEQVDDRQKRDYLRRKINKLKKRTRRLANAI